MTVPGQEAMFELPPLDIAPSDIAPAIKMSVTIGLHRTRRQRCFNCHQRRVCYYIGLGDAITTPRLCARCAGIR